MKKLKGFTLIELLAALLLLGIILGIGVIKFDFIGQYKEKLEINSIVDSLNFARNNAINTGYINKFSFNKNSEAIKISSDKEKHFIYFERLNYNGDDITIEFSSTGAPKKAATIYFIGKNKIYEITVEVATGKVNLSEEKRK
ncbi:prepilin-type N-terminal cleavage/methylation domain-containing protein [Miniphocaeibacter halophilus]|uniref:Prepilin-type N-terminal cleavage/methylation domain-containing protein n=1 Tax=Miniphocaeibacter halophilus TaxID=2931922 RepID=A0AC61MVK7_9FIRM|nr:prepilin-type N-terminal cleavage/methylation domain-containing protein [Miniphocaeibacter halophilus]QQK08624.1 prepilin-type N-terminal cleavage/methylation domain-containing protein [Miniphocaeibacter halophilus]